MVGLPIAMMIALVQAQPAAADAMVRCADDRIVERSAGCAQEADVPGPYMVFFRWGGTEIDRDGRDIVRKAAAAHAADPTLRIALRGYSDRSGAAAVNKVISARRAQLIRDALVEAGIAPGAIEVREAGGEDDLLVPTQDGVREAQNRRVEIHFEPKR